MSNTVVEILLDAKDNEGQSRIVDLSLECLYCMIGGSGSENNLSMLDSKDGRDVNVETNDVLLEYVSPLEIKLHKQVLSAIINRLGGAVATFRQQRQRGKQVPASSILRCSQLLARLLECDSASFNKVIYELLCEKSSGASPLEIWNELVFEDRNSPLKSLALANMGRLIGCLGKNNLQFFLKFSTPTQMGYLIETLLNVRVNGDFKHRVEEQITLKNAFSFLITLLDSSFDKTMLVNANLPSVLFKLF